MTPLVKRLKIFMEAENNNVKQLADRLGYRSPQKLYRLFNLPNASPSCEIIGDLANTFPDLDLNWLFTGKGKMRIGTKQKR